MNNIYHPVNHPDWQQASWTNVPDHKSPGETVIFPHKSTFSGSTAECFLFCFFSVDVITCLLRQDRSSLEKPFINCIYSILKPSKAQIFSLIGLKNVLYFSCCECGYSTQTLIFSFIKKWIFMFLPLSLMVHWHLPFQHKNAMCFRGKMFVFFFFFHVMKYLQC